MNCKQVDCLWNVKGEYCRCSFVSEINLSFLDASKKYLMCGNFTTNESVRNQDSRFGLLTEEKFQKIG
jgi:hypothetical protein